jgi:hypothetical protein
MKVVALLLLLVALPAPAQSVTTSATGGSAGPDARTLPINPAFEPRDGRLFFTPAERARLEAVRGKTAAAIEEAPNAIVVNGYIARTGQAPRAFIDGRAVPPQGLSGLAIAALPGGRLSVTQPDGRRVVAKPGQRVDLNAGIATEAFDVDRRRNDPVAPRALPTPFITANIPQFEPATKAKAPRKARKGSARRGRAAAAAPGAPPPAQIAPPPPAPMGAGAPAIPAPLPTPATR